MACTYYGHSSVVLQVSWKLDARMDSNFTLKVFCGFSAYLSLFSFSYGLGWVLFFCISLCILFQWSLTIIMVFLNYCSLLVSFKTLFSFLINFLLSHIPSFVHWPLVLYYFFHLTLPISLKAMPNCFYNSTQCRYNFKHFLQKIIKSSRL